MKTIQTRFGEVSYDPDKTIHFPKGLLGFEHLREFIVMPSDNEDPMLCIQSTEDPMVAFLLVDPTLFFPDYRVFPDDSASQVLGIASEDQCFVLSTITVHSDGRISINLLAPVLYAPKTDRALQIVLEGSGYQAKAFVPLKDHET